MRVSKPILLAATALVACLALRFAVSQWSRARHATTERQWQVEHHTRLSAQATALAQDLARLQQDDANPRPSPSIAPEASASPPTTPTPPLEIGTGGDMAELIAEHPEWLGPYQGRERAGFLSDYGPLFRVLGLTVMQRERFLAELSLREKKRAALRITATRNGWSNGAPPLVSLEQEEADRQARDLSSLLGAAGYRRFQEYERTLGVRYHVTELATQLYATSTPLDAETAERLVEVMARHATTAGGKVDFSAVRWDDAFLATKDILIPEQQAVFVRMGTAQQQQRRLNRIVATSRPPDAAP